MFRSLATLLVVGLGLPSPARAEEDYFARSEEARKVQRRERLPRSQGERILIASLFGGALVAGGLGTFFAAESKAHADEVSAQRPTGKAWSADLQTAYDRALTTRTRAIASYSVAGTLAVAGVVTVFLTDHGTRSVPLENVYLAPAGDAGWAVGASGWF